MRGLHDPLHDYTFESINNKIENAMRYTNGLIVNRLVNVGKGETFFITEKEILDIFIDLLVSKDEHGSYYWDGTCEGSRGYLFDNDEKTWHYLNKKTRVIVDYFPAKVEDSEVIK